MLHENREEVEAHVCAQVRLQEMVNQFQGVVLLLLLLKLVSVRPQHREDSVIVSGESVRKILYLLLLLKLMSVRINIMRNIMRILTLSVASQFGSVVLLLLLLKLLSVLPLHCEDSDSVSGKSVQNNNNNKKKKFYL